MGCVYSCLGHVLMQLGGREPKPTVHNQILKFKWRVQEIFAKGVDHETHERRGDGRYTPHSELGKTDLGSPLKDNFPISETQQFQGDSFCGCLIPKQEDRGGKG